MKVDGKQNYQCKLCERQFIRDHALSYQGCHLGIRTALYNKAVLRPNFYSINF